jgi:hypothetical protein
MLSGLVSTWSPPLVRTTAPTLAPPPLSTPPSVRNHAFTPSRVAAVGLWGGLDGFLASVTLGEDEPVDGGERRELRLGCGVRASDVCDAGTTHFAHPQRQG